MTNKNCDGIERAIFSGVAGEINNRLSFETRLGVKKIGQMSLQHRRREHF